MLCRNQSCAYILAYNAKLSISVTDFLLALIHSGAKIKIEKVELIHSGAKRKINKVELIRSGAKRRIDKVETPRHCS